MTIGPATFAAKYDATISERRMRALYGDSGYFNVGYWAGGAHDLPSACDRLADEMASLVPPGARVIVDAGCGLGAGTRRVATHFPHALVAGANISLWQLGQARTRGVIGAAMSATTLALRDGAADAVLAMESPHHFDTRDDFFAEARRALRPGGTIVLADMLFRDADAIGAWMIPQANRISSLPEYERRLARAGFTGIAVRDITAQSWTPFCAAMRTVFGEHQDAATAIERSLVYYVLAFARRA